MALYSRSENRVLEKRDWGTTKRRQYFSTGRETHRTHITTLLVALITVFSPLSGADISMRYEDSINTRLQCEEGQASFILDTGEDSSEKCFKFIDIGTRTNAGAGVSGWTVPRSCVLLQ
eukprot:gb/GECG01001566.1/.p1 GENE.gb/GECG01001566.1/~~gb/GECG01001566.1/.p1  ORF type:complete len:119 (+),score=5.86 gb/GECG01001566.1/:1-357(+)